MKILTLLIASLILTNPNNTKVEIPSIFSDNMVLQQQTEVSFWGKAEPDLQVNIKAGWGETASTKVDQENNWSLKINTPEAGGPYEISLKVGDSIIVYKNVLIGEVWLCSGQSNMEMPLEGWPPSDTILNSAEEIKNADYPAIRFFTVQHNFSTDEEFDITGDWEECNPSTAAKFSATAFFFGKKLYNELKVPIGLINSSWGGTPIESWIGKKHLGTVEEYKSTLLDIENSKEEIERYNEWLSSHPVIDVSKRHGSERWLDLDFDDVQCSNIDYPDTNWGLMELPTLWETSEVGNFDGVIWFRKTINIPESWNDKDLILELGPIDDMDRTFVNENLVGAYEKDGFWQKERVYKIPAGLVNNNEITIAVRVMDTQGGGGIYGSKDKLKIYPEDSTDFISLNGIWKYLPVAQYSGQKFFVFGSDKNDYNNRPSVGIDLSAWTPTSLFNGMINPIIPFSLKGYIWYQGESNTGNPEMYDTLLPLMIKNWRDEWNTPLPFYFVQIAPYNYGEGTKSERLREAQFKTLSVPNTGMVVTMDIGNPANIHPANKRGVGERLALWALSKNYNKNVSYSGPLYKSMLIENDKIILSFHYADDGLVLKERGGENNFTIAGEDSVFQKANVEINVDKLIVYHKDIADPKAVRYAWDNTSEATLFNKIGLPATSFRTDNWD